MNDKYVMGAFMIYIDHWNVKLRRFKLQKSNGREKKYNESEEGKRKMSLVWKQHRWKIETNIGKVYSEYTTKV